MKITCDYCGTTYNDTLEKCPSCGAPNPAPNRTSPAEPQTIEELKQYFDQNGYTKERTRFFIGEDYRGAKAFGIYKDNAGDFVVYKNKSDGSRAVRYHGSDEAYAVHEIYARFQSEVLNQKSHYLNERAGKTRGGQTVNTRQRRNNRRLRVMLLWFIIAWFAIVIFVAITNHITNRHNGYYKYNDAYYYRLGSDWYYYNDLLYDDWYPVDDDDVPYELSSDYEAYYEGQDIDGAGIVSDFTDTDYYSDWEDSRNSSNDSDSDWGADDWDSGWSDWDSDW